MITMYQVNKKFNVNKIKTLNVSKETEKTVTVSTAYGFAKEPSSHRMAKDSEYHAVFATKEQAIDSAKLRIKLKIDAYKRNIAELEAMSITIDNEEVAE